MREGNRLVKFGIILFCMVILAGCAIETRGARKDGPPPPPPGKMHHIGPLFVEDLDLMPDPVLPGQEVLFKARIRNDGGLLRPIIGILDRNQVVTQLDEAQFRYIMDQYPLLNPHQVVTPLEDVLLPHGVSNLLFPSTRYQFQRSDHCFVVIVYVDRTPYRLNAAREFCARPRGRGWTLKP